MDTSPNPRRAARKQRKLTLEDLAGELNVSIGQMSRIERYGTTSLAHAMKLAETLELPIAALAPQDGERAT